jgi:TolA-binding protein
MAEVASVKRGGRSRQVITFCLAMLLLGGGLSGCDQQQKGQQQNRQQLKADGQFTNGRNALMSAQFDGAIVELQGYLDDHPHGPLASRASFLIAKAQLGLGNHDQARKQFELTIRQFGDSEEAHKSRYKLGMLSLLDGDKQVARRRFAELVASPSGTLVPEATAMVRYLDAEQAAPAAEAN